MTIYFVGGEDLDFSVTNGTMGTTFAPSTTASSFRSGYARSSLQGSFAITDTAHYLRATLTSPQSSFWFTYRVNTLGAGNFFASGGNCVPIRFVDAAGVVRLYIRYTGSNISPSDTFQVFKENAALVSTQLGSTSPSRYMAQSTSTIFTIQPEKIDIFVNYGVSGQISVYLAGVLTFSFTGDLTTDGNTSLAAVDIGQAAVCSIQAGATNSSFISEVLVMDTDTRLENVVTRVENAFGNTHTFDGGTVANIANVSMAIGQTSPNFSGTAAQIQEFQVTPALPTGNFSVTAVVHKIQAVAGTSGPTKVNAMVRTGAADFTSADLSPGAGYWNTLMYAWMLNPNTGVAWTTADLPASSTSYNMGLKSVT